VKRIKKAIISAKSAIASVKANPKIARRNNSSFSLGFLDTARTKDPKMFPIPTPAPAKAKVANPAPINLPATNIIFIYKISFINTHTTMSFLTQNVSTNNTTIIFFNNIN